METLYWSLLIFGMLFAVITLLAGGMLDHWMHVLSGAHSPIFQPPMFIGGITVFGGSGLLLTRYTDWHTAVILLLSILAATLSSTVLYFIVVRPMEAAENSVGYSRQDSVGKLGEVTVPIPAQGFGEIVLSVPGGGLSNEIAASAEGAPIEAGCRVVVVSVRDHVLWVSPFEQN